MHVHLTCTQHKVVRSLNETLAMFTCRDFRQSEWNSFQMQILNEQLTFLIFGKCPMKISIYIYMQLEPNLCAFEEWHFTTL